MELTVLGISFTLLLLIGVPVAFAIGLSSIATILVAGLPMAVVFQKMVGGMQVFSFLAIPFFVFAGELMLYGGIAERIVRFANTGSKRAGSSACVPGRVVCLEPGPTELGGRSAPKFVCGRAKSPRPVAGPRGERQIPPLYLRARRGTSGLIRCTPQCRGVRRFTQRV